MKNMLKNIAVVALGLTVAAVLILPGISIADSAMTATISSPANGTTAQVGEAINFDASAAGGSGFYVYTWDFADGTSASGAASSKTYDTAGNYTVVVTATDVDGNQASDQVSVVITSAVSPLEVTITSPEAGTQLVVDTATNFSAEATGGSGFYVYTWDFADGTSASGAASSKTYDTAGNYTVVVTVTDTDGAQDSAQISVTVNGDTQPTAPTVDLKVNNSDGPVSITAGTNATLSWSSQNTTACTASGDWSGDKSTGSSETTGNLSAGSYTYTLACTGPGGSANDSVTVNASSNPGPTVSVNLQGSVSGTSVTLTWTSANVTTCTASGDWTGTKATSGSETIDNVTAGSHIYTITCTGTNGQATDSTTVTVGGTTSPLVITNVRVTDVTTTTAIVRWTTNRPANSRVIYDTTSHPDISGASEPNFGYAHSTATSDEDSLVTEHAVQLTGLTANTQYFFRVLSR